MANEVARPEASTEREAESQLFADKTVLITGASHRGIGGAIAERFARGGARLILTSLHEPTRLLKRLDRLDVECHWQGCDIRDQSGCQQLVEFCELQCGKLDVLVNNAGFEKAQRLVDMSDADVEETLQVNLHGTIRMTRLALPHFRSGGVIIQVSSALSLGGCLGYSAYSASKAALNGFTQSLAWELAPQQIRVVGVAPGLVHTPMIHKHMEHLDEQVKQQIDNCHPLGMGLPHDVAGVVAFLASPDARWITGVTIPIGWAPHYPLPSNVLV